MASTFVFQSIIKFRVCSEQLSHQINIISIKKLLIFNICDGEIPTQTNFVQETGNNSNNINSGSINSGNNNSNNNRSNNHSKDKVISSNSIGYNGETKGVGAVLGLRYEKFNKKLPFSQFVDKVYYYVISNFKDGGDLKPIFKKLQDPMTEFETKHMLLAIENPNDIQKEI